jgi:hypothetical protein
MSIHWRDSETLYGFHQEAEGHPVKNDPCLLDPINKGTSVSTDDDHKSQRRTKVCSHTPFPIEKTLFSLGDAGLKLLGLQPKKPCSSMLPFVSSSFTYTWTKASRHIVHLALQVKKRLGPATSCTLQ